MCVWWACFDIEAGEPALFAVVAPYAGPRKDGAIVIAEIRPCPGASRTVWQREAVEDDQTAGFGIAKLSLVRPDLAEPDVVAGRFVAMWRMRGRWQAPAHGLDPALSFDLADDEAGAAGPEFRRPIGRARSLALEVVGDFAEAGAAIIECGQDRTPLGQKL
ncbi:RNA polymerase sigma-70 factor, ECF subfamily [Sphingopyxis macrogoltabida]|nr:RNA polymerase sigma-70 factor, ECF subfamily [Sphingopyxis macrogoltabida]